MLAGENSGAVTFVELHALEVNVSGVGGQRYLVLLRVAVLLNRERVATRLYLLQWNVQIERILRGFTRVAGRLERDIHVLVLVVGESDVLDAGGAVALQGEVVVLAGKQLRVADDLPTLAVHLLQRQCRSVEGIEAPETTNCTRDGEIGAGGGLWPGVRGWRSGL